jgi:hypothetical protein
MIRINTALLEMILFAKLHFKILSGDDIKLRVEKTLTKTYYPPNWIYK